MLTRSIFEGLDQDDPLAPFYDDFVLPDGLIYLDGNSLGAVPKKTLPRISEVIKREWGEGLIRSWEDRGWMSLPMTLGDKIAGLIGALPGEVAVCDSVSINLYKVLWAAISKASHRSVVLTDRANFPTNLYVAGGLSSILEEKLDVRVIESRRLETEINSDVAVLFLTHVDFRSGSRYNLERISRLAQSCGVLTVWDLSHSAGVMPLDLSKVGVDFAVGCGYKYLNGGPGAPGYLYVAKRWQDQVTTPLRGWMGHASPFDFSNDYIPATGVRRMLSGSPPILSMIALDVAVDLLLRAKLTDIREKSLKLTSLFMEVLAQYADNYDFQILTPVDEKDRGGQVSISCSAASERLQSLAKSGLIGDFRPPDLLRFGFSPLYTRYVDVWDASNMLLKVLKPQD